MKGYFTVEAACVLPLVLCVFMFLIYAMFYQYDRCLLEQDAALAAIEEQERGKETFGSLRQAAGWLAGRESDRYLFFQSEGSTMKKEGGRIKVQVGGKVSAPTAFIKNLGVWGDWEITASFTCREIRPAEWIRTCRMLMEEIEDVAD